MKRHDEGSAAQSKTALFLAPERPYPAIGGGALRSASLLEYLAQRYVVDVVGFREEGAPGLEFPEGLIRMADTIRLPFHSRDTAARIQRNLRRWVRGVPPLLDRFSGFSDQVEAVLASRTYDLAIVEHFWCAPYLPLLRKVAGRVVLDLHNIESELQATMASAASGPSRLAYERFRRAYQDAEAHWLPQFDLVLVTSDDDLVRAQRIAPKAKFAVYPNAIPLRTAPSRTPERAFVFSGNLAYAPNITAVEWFAREVWPLARSLNYKWRLVGMHPEAVSSIVGSDARLIGPVEDAVEELAGSQIAIVPLRSGSGTRFKILEAWAACRPVVSTTLGAEGLNARHEEHLLLADTPQQFHQAMKRLVGDPALQARLGAAGRRLYEERFTWPVAWRTIEDLL